MEINSNISQSGFGLNPSDLGSVMGQYNSVSETNHQVDINARMTIKDQAVSVANDYVDGFAGIFNPQNPDKPVLFSPSPMESDKVDGIKNRIAEIVNTPPSEIPSPNAFLAAYVFVELRMLIYEAISMMSAAKVLEKKLDIMAMESMYDMAVVKAGLIMDAAKTEAIMHIVDAVVNFAQALSSVSALGAMRKAKKPDLQSSKQYGEAQNDLLKVDDNMQKMQKIKSDFKDKHPGMDFDKPPLSKSQRDEYDRLNDMNSNTASSAPVDYAKKTRTQEEEKIFQELDKSKNSGVVDDKVALEIDHAKAEYNRLEKESKDILKSRGYDSGNPAVDRNALRDHVHELKQSHERVRETSQYKLDRIRTWNDAWRAFTTSFNYASKAVLTIEKAKFEAQQQLVDASQKISEKMMNSASQAFNDLSQQITKMLDDLTKAVSAITQAITISTR